MLGYFTLCVICESRKEEAQDKNRIRTIGDKLMIVKRTQKDGWGEEEYIGIRSKSLREQGNYLSRLVHIGTKY